MASLRPPAPDWLSAYGVPEYMRAGRRRWKVAAAGAVAGLAAAAVWCWWSPDSYLSYAQLVFLPPQISEKFVESNISLQAEQRVNTLTQMLGSNLTAGKIIQEFGLYPHLRRWWPVADLIPYFRRDLNVSVATPQAGGPGGSKVSNVRVSFRYRDPAVAQKVVQRVLEVIYEENQRYRGTQTFRTTDFLQRQTREVQEQLRETEDKLQALKIPDPETRFQATAMATEKLYEIHRRVYSHQSQMRSLEQDRELKRHQLSSLEKRLAQIQKEADRPVQHTWAGEHWRVKLAEARADAEDARLRYREGNPDRAASERHLQRVLAELRNVEESERSLNENQQRHLLRDQVARMRADIEGISANLDAAAKQEAGMLAEERKAFLEAQPNRVDRYQHMALIREHELLKERYAQLLAKQRDSETATEMERIGQGETIELIEPPVLPSSPQWPLRWMKLAAGAAAGLLLGAIVPLAMLLQRPRVQSNRNFEALLGVPLLAELPAARLRQSIAAPPGRRGGGRRIRIVITKTALLLLAAGMGAGCARQSPAQLLDQARQARRQGRPAEAGLLLRKAIQLDRRLGEAYRELSALALEQGEITSAQQALVRAVELLPADAALRSRLAEVSYRLYFADPSRPERLLREVEECARQLRETWPGNPDGYRFQAQVLLERRQIGEAVAMLERGLARLPGDASLTTQLAAAAYQSGDHDAPTRLLLALVESGSRFPPAYDLLYLQLMGARDTARAAWVLERKWLNTGTFEAALQVAAHRDAAGQRSAAEQLIDEAAAVHRADPRTHLGAADFWFHRGEMTRTRRWLAEGRRLHPAAWSQFTGREVELLLAERRRQEARRLLDAERSGRPEDPVLEAYNAALDLDESQGDQARTARVRLEAILNRMPDSPFVRYHLGRAYMRAGDVARAGDQFERCVTLDPNYASGWLALAEAHMAQGQFSRAAAETRALQERGAAMAPAYLINARAELARNRPAEAEQALAGLLRLDPGHAEARALMAQAKLGLGQREEARRWMAGLLEKRTGDPGLIVAVARLEAQLGRPEAALRRLEEARRAHPASNEVTIALARMAMRMGNAALALDQYRTLAAGAPQMLEYRLGVANCLGLLNRSAEAAAAYREIQKSNGGDPRPWLYHAVLMTEAGQWSAAIQGYREVLARDSRNPFALNNLADILARHGGDVSEALGYAEEASRLMPGAAEVADTLAFLYLKKGMARSAIAHYEKVAAQAPAAERAALRERIRRLEKGEAAAVLAELDRAPAQPGSGT